MKKVLFVIVFLISAIAIAQEEEKESDSDSELNILTAPASPGANLLGFATSDIEKPTELSDLMLSLQTASSSFSKLISNYAVDFAPFLALKMAGDISIDGKSRDKNIIPQTFVLSLAVKNTDSTETVLNKESVYGALGFKFSIVRGNFDDTTVKQLKIIDSLQAKKILLLQDVSNTIQTDKGILELENERNKLLESHSEDSKEIKDVKAKIEKETEKVTAKVDLSNKTLVDEIDVLIQKTASKFQISRIGWSWDFAGGISSEFVDKNFSKAKINNAGLWTTGGFSFQKSGTCLALVRYLYNPNQIYANDNAVNEWDNISTLDAGFRYVYGESQSKFNLSLEAIYRSVIGNSHIDPTWRLVFNTDYAIYKNQKLTFSFGRNFDGTTTKDGNLIAALSFVKGFGNSRTIK